MKTLKSELRSQENIEDGMVSRVLAAKADKKVKWMVWPYISPKEKSAGIKFSIKF